LVVFDYLNKVSQISECLLRVQKSHVLDAKGVLSKGKRLTVEAVLQSNDHAAQPLGVSEDPGSIFRHTTAGPLPANVEEDGTHCGVEVLVVDPVPLVPQSGVPIIVVVQYLAEPMLTRLVSLFRSLAFLEEKVVLRVVSRQREDQQKA
jgi:hypothetical protein